MPAAKLSRVVTGVLLVGWSIIFVLAVVAWLLPLDVVQAWAIGRTDGSEFAVFEAYGAITATVWFIRWTTSLLTVLLGGAWYRRRKTVPAILQTIAAFWEATLSESPPSSTRVSLRMLRTSLVRLLVVSWLVLGVYQFGCSINRRLWDWPVYELKTGQSILPNISDTNREVIRYVAAATPPNARILVLSDQKLFFLSYYLLPRRLSHPSHPDSEFVIAKAYNERQLAAYRLQDLTAERIRDLQPDYILEYFEGKEFIDGENLERDEVWLNYQRRRYGPNWRPSYLVSLRRYSAEKAP